MTVQELIDLLQALPDKTLGIKSDGCDCIDWAEGISVVHADWPEPYDYVLVERA